MGPFGRPADVDPAALAVAREQALHAVEGFLQYELESHYTPKWRCPCGTLNECAVTTCHQCGDNRPEILHGDPAQGDEILGLARMVARKQVNTLGDIPATYLQEVETWRSSQGHSTDEFLFDTERRGGSHFVTWRQYISFLLQGGRV